VDNDKVLPTAALSLNAVLPTPVADPYAQFHLVVSDSVVTFRATKLDTVGRRWALDWDHLPYAYGPHVVAFTAMDSLTTSHRFVVSDATQGGRLLGNVMAFPNPFDDQIGTSFSLYLLSQGPADVLVQVFTVAGRLIYQRAERGLLPGGHDLPWNGHDAEGEILANGVYIFRVMATADGRSDRINGRLVKLRKPHHADSP
jgi:hypothetical protein